jgi:hypothetical protein
MRHALSEALQKFRQSPAAKSRVLVLLPDGKSTDEDPRLLGKDLRHEKVKIATVYLKKKKAIPERRLYYQKAETLTTASSLYLTLPRESPA